METPYSVADIYPYFYSPPEFGAYVLDPSLGASTLDNALSTSTAQKMLERDLASYGSLLNIMNVRYLYSQY